MTALTVLRLPCCRHVCVCCVREQAQRSWNPRYSLAGGDAVIIESHEQLLKLHTHSDHFALLREVIDSKPPITSEFMDVYVLNASRSVTCFPWFFRRLTAYRQLLLFLSPCLSRRCNLGTLLIFASLVRLQAPCALPPVPCDYRC